MNIIVDNVDSNEPNGKLFAEAIDGRKITIMLEGVEFVELDHEQNTLTACPSHEIMEDIPVKDDVYINADGWFHQFYELRIETMRNVTLIKLKPKIQPKWGHYIPQFERGGK